MPSKRAVKNIFNGQFVLSPSAIEQKLQQIKAYIFDWDGVFNDGHKFADGSSSFSETDSMGTNLLRFNHYLQHKQLPVIAIITGEHNKAAFHFATRESFNDVYYKIKHKKTALQHFCEQNKIKPSEVLFVFDDVLDFSAAKIAGLRIMVSHSCNPLLIEVAIKNKLVDYITFHDGANGAVREVSELIMFLSGIFDKAIDERARYSKEYQTYIGKRNAQATGFYTLNNTVITQQHPL
jgi:3-deoxy-D-manno-octulosonate 8-phosphate phosphatase (KDO 8-P phosphatase)